MDRVRDDDVEWRRYDRDDARFRRKELSNAATADEGTPDEDPAIGCSLYAIEPGDRSWPYHYHTANAEALYVLDGSGTLHHSDGEAALREGDYVALPPDEDGAHRIVNDGDETLRYLAVSTMREPDVTVYPEMDKVGVFVGAPPGGRAERSLHGYYPNDADVGYWEDDG